MNICLKVKSVTNPINIWKNQDNLIVQLLEFFWVPTILVSQNASSLLLWCNYVSFLSCWSSQSNISSTKLTTGQISPGLQWWNIPCKAGWGFGLRFGRYGRVHLKRRGEPASGVMRIHCENPYCTDSFFNNCHLLWITQYSYYIFQKEIFISMLFSFYVFETSLM